MKNVLLPMLLCLSVPVFSQIKIDSFFTLTGSVDMYFRYNLNSTNDATNGGSLAPATSFANLPGFAMGMFNIVAKYEKGKTGFVTDLVFGPRGRDAVFNSPASLNIVNQAYAYFKPNDKLTFTLGKFNTFLSYEVISPVLNYHYSTSYMFSFGPFNHAGLKANYDLGKGFGVMAGIFNPTDYTDSNPDDVYYFGGQLSYVFGLGSVYLNTLLNKDYKQFDLTSSLKVSNTLNFGLHATTASDFFSGIAVFSNLALIEGFSAGIRAEYFKDDGIGILDNGIEPTTTSNHVFDVTLSSNITIGQLRIIPEYRIDMYSDNLVLPDATSLLRKDNLSSLLVAAVYSF